MNKVYKVIYNFAKGQYEVVSELAKSAGKKPQTTVGRSFSHSRKVLARSILAALLIFGGVCGVSADGQQQIRNNDIVYGGANINVVAHEEGGTTNGITISATGLATTDALTTETNNRTSADTRLTESIGTIPTGTQTTYIHATDGSSNPISVYGNMTALDTHVAANATAINALNSTTGGGAVKYDTVTDPTADHASTITLNNGVGTGNTGTTITNLADGTVSASSTDAINGRVLYNTVGTVTPGNYITATTAVGDTTRNTTVAENLGALDTAIGKVTADGNYITASTTAGGVTTPTSVSNNLTNLDTQVKKNADAIGDSDDITSTNYISAGMATDPVSINKNLSALDSEIGAFNTSGYHYIQQGTSGNTVASDLGALDTNLHNLSQALGITDTTNYTGIKYFHANSNGTDDDSQAIGTDAVAIGKNATAGQRSGTGEESTTTGTNAVAIGNNTNAQANNSVAIGGGNASGTGHAASSTGAAAVAIGTGSSATTSGSVALGQNALAQGTAVNTGTTEAPVMTLHSSVAVGNNSQASASGSVAVGDTARGSTHAVDSVTIGQGAVSGATSSMVPDEGNEDIIDNGGNASVSIGKSANARADSSIALGNAARVDNDTSGGGLLNNSIAMGTSAHTSSGSATAIGNKAHVSNGSTGGIAIGEEATVSHGTSAGDATDANNAIAMGTSASASAGQAVAVGNDAAAGGLAAIAIGGKTSDTGSTSASATGEYSVAIGASAKAAANHTVAIGANAGVGGVADPANQNGAHVMIGDSAGKYNSGQQNVAMGVNAGSNSTTLRSDHNIAIGVNAGTNIGTSNTSTNSEGKNVSIGYNANNLTTAEARLQSTALGSETNAADNATAVGYSADATGANSTAVGMNASATDSNSVALGTGATASGGNVALGANSTATTAMTTQRDTTTTAAYLTGQAAPSSYVSVGTANNTRRITNVADGAADSDVATVHQLKQVITNAVDRINNSTVTPTEGTAVTYNTVTEGSDPSITLNNSTGKGTRIGMVADGTADQDAVNVRQLNSAVNGAKTHYYSVKSATSQGNHDNDGASGTDALAAGVNTLAQGNQSVAVGNNAEAQETGSIAIGTLHGTRETLAQGEYSTAMGAGAQADGNSSIAIGTDAKTLADYNAGSTVNHAMAIGYAANAAADNTIAMGSNTEASQSGAIAIGNSTKTRAVNAGAIGSSNTLYSVSRGTYVVGNNNGDGGTADTSNNVGAVNSGVFGNSNVVQGGVGDSTVTNEDGTTTTVTGSGNRVIGNSNSVVKNAMGTKTLTNIMVTGNSNTVAGDPNHDTASAAANVTDITITGANNTVQARNNYHDLTGVSIIGSNNTVRDTNATSASDPNAYMSNTQILGSSVTATVGNSVYLGSGSSATSAGDISTDGTTGRTAGARTYATSSQPFATARNGAAFAGSAATGVVTVGSAGSERRIQNVAAGAITSTSTDAVNGSELYYATRDHHFTGDSGTTVNVGSDGQMQITGGVTDASQLSTANNIGTVGNGTNNTMTLRLNRDLTGMHSTTYDTTSDGTAADYSTVVNNEGITINHTQTPTATDTLKPDGRPVKYIGKHYTNVTLTDAGLNNGGNRITNVAQGVNDDDAVNVSQLRHMTGETYFRGDQGDEIEMASNDHMIITGGATGALTDNNIAVTTTSYGDAINPTGVTHIQLASDLTGLNSVTTNNVTTNNLTVNNGGDVNMGGNQVHNVADGTDTYDAVNVGQLDRGLNHLGNRINHVGANAAALAALHPLDFDPDDKWDFAAGYGNYRSANSVAVGAFYRPNEDTMFNVGAAFGGGENMINAGFSIKLGQGNHVSTSRVAMAKEIRDMKKQLADQSAEIERLKSMHGIAFDPQKSALFPDVAENHWAYDYVTKLAGNGILEGYPDGEFKGDRMMTRYEFAAIVYRIVESGAGAQDPELSKLVKEFTPELKYIRIDTISHDKNGNPTIERVRVNKPVKQ